MSTEAAEGSPSSYRVLFEVALSAVVILLLYLLHSKKEAPEKERDENMNEKVSSEEILEKIHQTEDALPENLRKRSVAKSSDVNQSTQRVGNEESEREQASQESRNMTARADDNQNDVGGQGDAAERTGAAISPISSEDKETQTEPESITTPCDISSDLAILWRAILVDAEAQKQARYRTELRVAVDGAISHSESFQTEGIAGVGMEQVLVKVK